MHVSTQVIVRDQLGRFIKDIEDAAPEAIGRALDVGTAAARARVAERTKVRTGSLLGGFRPALLSRTSGVLVNVAPWAGYQDEGTAPHDISAHVHFYWERMGRYWMWPELYQRVTGFPGADPIHHPGNPAVGFMDAGYRAMMRALPRIIADVYPR